MRAKILVAISILSALLTTLATTGATADHEESSLFDFPEATYIVAQAKTDAEIAADIKASQKLLAELGYFSGSATGKESSSLTSAVKKYQRDNGLKSSGKANGVLVRSLESAVKKAELHGKRILVVEQMLKKLDYSPGRVDGKEDASLTKAIKAFQTDRKSKAKKKGVVNGVVIRSLRVAMEAKGLTPPKAAFTLSNATGKSTGSSSKKKKTTSSKSKSSSSSSTTKSKSKSAQATEPQGDCKKGEAKIGEKCLKACKENYTRDKKTNRCKKDSSASSTKTTTKKTSSKAVQGKCKSGQEQVGEKCLKACKENYTRDAKSSRCKKNAASSTTTKSKTKSAACKSGSERVGEKCLKKCKTDYKRDTKTNKCKKNASTSKTKTSTKAKACKSGTEKVGSKCLKKCKSGYKRDSKTKRCKKN